MSEKARKRNGARAAPTAGASASASASPNKPASSEVTPTPAPPSSSKPAPTRAPAPDASNTPAKEKRKEKVKEKKSAPAAGMHVLWNAVLLASALTLAFLVYRLKCPIEPAYFELEPPPALAGPLAPNDYIARHGKRQYLTRLAGPEHIEPCNGALYTGTRDSKIWRLDGERATMVVNPGGPKCARLDTGEEYADCGRPLGMRCVNGTLFVADGHLGLLRVSTGGNKDLSQTSTSTLVRSDEMVDGFPMRNLNAVETLPDGRLVLTQPDATRPHSENVYSLLEHLPNGRLLVYDPKKGSEGGAVEVLKTGLYFPNGVVLTHDKHAILFAETAKHRVMKLHIDGPQKGNVEPFALNLPGFPDNLARSSDGGYWVAIVSPRHDGSFDSYGFAGRHPRLRHWLTKMIPRAALGALSFYFPATYVVKLAADGRVVGALHDPSHGVVGGHVTHAMEADGALFLGSSLFNYVVRVDLREHLEQKQQL